ncbi:hypothetical protein M2T70_04805 [Elizabethkingia anophelis]|uniref:hypothetical protein n=1 Tax=Elizabethkingia anophelis TaxID=1117645 RepID=UPI000BA8A270|nr:hypothetical protein [Elizabethkingia anophelis]ASV77948.1 hypothetical protein A6J37_04560 [Elizabethkingia anophelis]MCL1648264.1 hypothetical protein [Elizabethkingia anophelis]MCL1683658.1 hypothetical protein [Elizabethkingia anophelis]MDV3460765.1 hypothetical protein [Elizabethkingia anophelis]MDV3571636.1 hypothetical protein [Elizabethkingia anophelis]
MNELTELTDRLREYSTLFSSMLEDLFNIQNDLIDKCNSQIREQHYNDVEDTISQLFTMHWVIRDKLPESLFEDIEQLCFKLQTLN